MAVPGFQELTLPVLRAFADGQEHSTSNVRDHVGKILRLTVEDLAELLPSGRQTRFVNRIAWAHVYLKQAALLESPRRGFYRITVRGRDVLAAPPDRIDIGFLMQFPEMREFRSRRGEENDRNTADAAANGRAHPDLTPDEQIRAGYQRLRESLAAQVLTRVQESSPRFFESMVVELLVAMGYGGSHEDAAQVVGKGGDEGIDGVIKEDRLGLESIYIQAKRWQGTVGRPIIQQFAGALQGRAARKGVLIATSSFSKEAIEYAKALPTSIVLVDGVQLAQLMIDFDVGVSESETMKIKRLDEDYFAEE